MLDQYDQDLLPQEVLQAYWCNAVNVLLFVLVEHRLRVVKTVCTRPLLANTACHI